MPYVGFLLFKPIFMKIWFFQNLSAYEIFSTLLNFILSNSSEIWSLKFKGIKLPSPLSDVVYFTIMFSRGNGCHLFDKKFVWLGAY